MIKKKSKKKNKTDLLRSQPNSSYIITDIDRCMHIVSLFYMVWFFLMPIALAIQYNQPTKFLKSEKDTEEIFGCRRTLKATAKTSCLMARIQDLHPSSKQQHILFNLCI